MRSWTSPSDIALEFDLADYSDNPEQLRKELRLKVKELHPDTNSDGEFKTPEDEKEFNKITEAMSFLDAYSKGQGALIPVSQVQSVMETFAKSLAAQNKESPAQIRTTIISDVRSRLSHRSFFPKIGSGVFAAITAFLTVLPADYAQHPILGGILSDPIASRLLLQLTFMSSLFFIFTWFFERRAKQKQSI